MIWNKERANEKALSYLDRPRFVRERTFGQTLVSKKIINHEQLKHAMKMAHSQGRPLRQILIELGYADEETVLSRFVARFSIPFIELSNYLFEKDIINLIPNEMARRLHLIPIDKVGKVLVVAMLDPLDEEAKEEISEFTSLQIKEVTSYAEDIRTALERYY